jgi:hypothetical protein
VSGVAPIAGIAADRRLVPEYPGITGAENLSDWDPPFPIDLLRVRPVDEAYWRQFRTTPKVFVPYERGRDLWRSRYGVPTSLRFFLGDGSKADDSLASVQPHAAIGSVGVGDERGISPARTIAPSASAGATDFGEHFTYFSFFLVVSALLPVVLFFKLGVEQRLRQMGILRASGLRWLTSAG